ncbi:MAG: class II aldolase/adducin family protein [Pseudomonadota bacterium]
MDEIEARRDLAAAFRWCARHEMNEGVANHFSLALDDAGQTFLMNPAGRHWSLIKASDLVLLDASEEPDGVGTGIDPTAWAIHGALHRKHSGARCVMHLHTPYATALSALADPVLPPVDQTTMRFYNRVSIDMGFDGMGLGDEAERLAGALGNHRVMMMAQHGVLTVGSSVAEAFDLIYYYERGARTYMMALQTGRPLNVASAEVAEKTAQQWEEYPDGWDAHMRGIRDVLDVEAPDYAH